ncbi:hypothetical protein J4E83_000811 [Alternaria metachromatica]|uniref:uncharacterized protein n=1 Tax=Alternaria metachromatica TaxID=283354 RepID=UPI0020C41CD0|nr:uncharacterized protein J4E83_000811 [Alternaria metachromatica]KAI4637989.1 hypothetical protein J4E83_000811 [Alternaria metachromatica]
MQDLRYTQLREVDPSAAKAQMEVYERYVQDRFAVKPYDICPTVDMLVNEIDFIEIKEPDGDLRWRYDAALTLARQMYQPLLKYGFGRTPLDNPTCVALQQADIQLDHIISDMHENFGDEVDLREVHNWMVANQNILKQRQGITEYYPGSIWQLELRLRRAG